MTCISLKLSPFSSSHSKAQGYFLACLAELAGVHKWTPQLSPALPVPSHRHYVLLAKKPFWWGAGFIGNYIVLTTWWVTENQKTVLRNGHSTGTFHRLAESQNGLGWKGTLMLISCRRQCTFRTAWHVLVFAMGCRSRPAAVPNLARLRCLISSVLHSSKGWHRQSLFSAGFLQAWSFFFSQEKKCCFVFPPQIYLPEQGIFHLFKISCPLPFPTCCSGLRDKSNNNPAVFPLLPSHCVQIAVPHCASSTDQSRAADMHLRNNWAADIRTTSTL